MNNSLKVTTSVLSFRRKLISNGFSVSTTHHHHLVSDLVLLHETGYILVCSSPPSVCGALRALSGRPALKNMYTIVVGCLLISVTDTYTHTIHLPAQSFSSIYRLCGSASSKNQLCRGVTVAVVVGRRDISHSFVPHFSDSN